MGKYFDEMCRAMEMLGQQKETFFIGQAVSCEGTAMFNTLKDVSLEKRLELPVFENTQLGLSIGMALNGTKVISIFPRWNFLLCAMDQLINHLDKLPDYSAGQYKPKVIIRTGIGSIKPLDPQHQHKGDFTEPLRQMLTNVEIIRLDKAEDIFPAYERALTEEGKSFIIVEWSDLYNE